MTTSRQDWIKKSEYYKDFISITRSIFPEIDSEVLVFEFGLSVVYLLDNAKLHSKDRQHPVPEIDKNWFLDTYIAQKGRCKYNETLLIDFRRTGVIDQNHRMSLERLDQSVGYMKENCVLICLQYNGFMQFSKELIQQLANGRFREQPIIDIQEHIKKRKSKIGTTQLKKRKILNGDSMLCYNCNVILPLSSFRMKKSSIIRRNGSIKASPYYHCRPCSAALGKEKRDNDVRSTIVKLLGGCRCSSKTRLKTHVKTCQDENCLKCKNWGVDIDFEWVVQQFEATKGRCAYSEYPLQILPGSSFSMSIERVDDAVDYKRSNCVLICRILQVGAGVKWTKKGFFEDHEHLMVEN